MNRITGMARLNHKNYKTLSRNSVLNMIVGSVLFLLVVSFGISTTKLVKNYNHQDVALRRLSISPEPNELTDEQLMKFRIIPNVKTMHVAYSISMTKDFTIRIDDFQIKGFRLEGAHVNYSTFDLLDIMEKNDENLIEPIVYGRSFHALDQKVAIVDENMLYILGNTAEEILGKQIEIQVGDRIIDSIEIVGIYDWSLGSIPQRLDNLSEQERLSYIEYGYPQPIIVSQDVINDIVENGGGIRARASAMRMVTVYATSTKHVRQIYEDISGITDNWIFSEIAAIEQKTKAINDLGFLIIVIASFVLVVSLVSIVNVLIIKISEQRKLTVNVNIKFTNFERDRFTHFGYSFTLIFYLIRCSVFYL